ncbi:MAG: bifunctional adenosylcobinamide kinase/adenosylcobinamide-phosphate guanylyltransferase [Ruminococcus sp.]|uniref:bifunctional adenosylcobinamide kinase/adenosylcobinamide-phosphate guanylyltransferase n=1 Tax=Ruminococcus sp. TaxID=41978 RepID=UPI0025D37482|nr:bifunctional adenosylcobinamide kinase/adenosylcobinamide-phosphate guanylyltransferase [Ruminococcus sp.]MCR5600916.1 bifunctional adenosylcobinamide kinase/adenosylcobinamide-phosphate guanylyltransferase [Ruminococcus sp.]
MKMIIGGAYQGKIRFACNWLDMDRADMINGSTCDFEEAFSADVIKSYHRLIARLLAEGVDPVEFTKKLCEQNKDAVIIMDETGCGIVPIEKSDRTRREVTGRCGCIIARESDTVIRVICGIPTYLKGAPNEG